MGIRDAWRALFKRANAPQTRPLKGEIGYTGNKIFSGLPMDEYNPELAFPDSVQVYDQMRRSDGQIAAILMAMKLPIRSTKWYVEPPEDGGEEGEQIAAFISDNLFGGMKYSWDDHLREALTMLEFGFSVFEKVWRFDNWNGRPVVVLDKYAPRVATSIWRFPQNEAGDIVEVQQINYYTGQLYSIPLSKCRLYVYNREGDNPVGISVLRPAYKHWWYKDNLYKVMAVGVEKSLIGTPYAKLPKGASKEDQERVLQVLTAIRTAEEAGFTVPEGVEIALLEGKRNAVDAMPLLEHHDTMIARSVLAQFLNLGTMSSASGGAYALGREMVDLFVMALESVANYIQGEVQKDIEQLVEWNFGPDAPVPQLKHKNITFRDLSQVAQALYWLGSGHMVTPDESLEDTIREMLGLPPIPKEALKNQMLLPPNRNIPEIIPDEQMSPLEQQAAARQQQQAGQSVAASDPSRGFSFADDQGQGDGSGGDDKPRTQQTWRRDLTPYENEQALTRINRQWQRLEQQWQNRLSQQQKKAAQALVEQVRQIVISRLSQINMMSAVNHLQVPADIRHAYEQQIEQLLQQAYEAGAQSTAQELETEAQILHLDAEALAQIRAKAQLLAANQLGKLTDAVKLAVLNSLSKGAEPNEVIKGAKNAAATHIDGGQDLKVSGMISIGEALNIGRGATARAKGVQGAQWSAVLDSHTCPLCEHLDGKVISVDNPDFDVFRPPLHPGCRCILVYIGTGQSHVEYTWETPPRHLVEKYGNLIL